MPVTAMTETILEGMAEYYSVDLSEKVVRGMTDNALKCMFNAAHCQLDISSTRDNIFRLTPLPRLSSLQLLRNMLTVQR